MRDNFRTMEECVVWSGLMKGENKDRKAEEPEM